LAKLSVVQLVGLRCSRVGWPLLWLLYAWGSDPRSHSTVLC